MENSKKFLQRMNNPIQQGLFLLFKLPSAWLSGVRIKTLDEKKCEVTVPYWWFSQNPFRSTYFACLAMAAEMSTGALGLLHTENRQPSVAMLVTHLSANFLKKATDLTTFTCEEGEKIQQAITESIRTQKPQTVIVQSVGKNKAGEVVAEFTVTWSFKSRG